MTQLRFFLAIAATMSLYGLTPTTATADQSVGVTATVSTPTMLADQKNMTFLRVALDGPVLIADAKRPPVNVAIVIDKSGSMGGPRIEQAKLAAIAAVERLRNNDIVSIVLYDSVIEVLVPSTKATDRESIIQKIRTVQVGSSTALFAGVAAGAAEVRKFLDRSSVNRVILLSDGIANVGPSSPMELADLGRSLAKENISVSTLGVGQGYNEDLMMQLASASSGNHVFIEDEASLVAIFNREFDTLMSVVASEIRIDIKLPESVRPVRVLGTDASIDGRNVAIPLTQLYSGQNRYFIIELEVNAAAAGKEAKVADVSVSYTNTDSKVRETRQMAVASQFTTSAEVVENDTNLETLAYATVLVSTERNRMATALRDAGKVSEAQALLNINAIDLFKCAASCEAKNVTSVVPMLKENVVENRLQTDEIVDSEKWNSSRKRMIEYQNGNLQQQVYDGGYRSSSTKP